jgi:hypothetical protein
METEESWHPEIWPKRGLYGGPDGGQMGTRYWGIGMTRWELSHPQTSYVIGDYRLPAPTVHGW